ncbi:hypothetical protein C4J81_04945 [Deltaproteobacteria bacterium Smac51]|nr:hypothetical protein C4J81_04945 [Deltaproteobacteria bacterium Smac51]
MMLNCQSHLDLVEGLIDGQAVEVARDTTILAAVRLLNRSVPTLCHHEGLPGDGNCRLCLVEINGRMVTSCMYPLRENGFVVETDNEDIRRARAFVLEMLVDRCPSSPRLMALAAEYGVTPEERFKGDDDLCIRCGRCVRACEINGTAAIGFAGRGAERSVTGPFFTAPDDCIGCLACAAVCPTGKIVFSEKHGRRSIWGREFEMVRCCECGRPYATPGQLSRPEFAANEICAQCRRRLMAADMKRSFTEY